MAEVSTASWAREPSCSRQICPKRCSSSTMAASARSHVARATLLSSPVSYTLLSQCAITCPVVSYKALKYKKECCIVGLGTTVMQHTRTMHVHVGKMLCAFHHICKNTFLFFFCANFMNTFLINLLFWLF